MGCTVKEAKGEVRIGLPVVRVAGTACRIRVLSTVYLLKLHRS